MKKSSTKCKNVDEVLKKYYLKIYVPALTLLFVFAILTPCLGFLLNDSLLTNIMMLSSIILTFFSPFLWYKYFSFGAMVKAYEEVLDYHKLFDRATKLGVFPNQNSFLFNTLYKSKKDIVMWNFLIEFKDKNLKELVVDYKLPKQYDFKTSRAFLYSTLITSIIFISLYFFNKPLFDKEVYKMAAFVFPVGCFLLDLMFIIKGKNNAVSLNDKGVQTKKYGFIPWSDIVDYGTSLNTVSLATGHGETHNFIIKTIDNTFTLRMSYFTKINNLEYIFDVYYDRYKRK